MNLSANYNVGLRKFFGPSAPKNETFFGVPSVFALANLSKLASPVRTLTCSAEKMSPGHFYRFRSHTALGLKNFLESLTLLLCG